MIMLSKMKYILSLLCLFLGVALIEIYFRLFNPQLTLSRTQFFSFKCFEKGIHRWVKLKSSADCTLKSRNQAFKDVTVKTNSLGLRNPEIGKKNKETKRILFIGDSFTMGWGVEENKAFPRVVENVLNQTYKVKAETINAGFIAAGPSGYYIYLKRYGLDLDPDVVVVGFYIGNDITSRLDVEWIDTDEEGLPDVIKSKSSYVDSDGKLRLRNTSIKYNLPFLRDSHTFIFFADRFFPKQPQVYDPVITPLICLFKKTCQDMDKAKDEVKKIFKGIKKLTDEKGIKLLVAMIPIEFQAYDYPYLEEKYGLTIPLLPSDKRRPNVYFSHFFEEQKIEYVDLLPILQQNQDIPAYYEFDDHWNPTGHRIAAEAIKGQILEYLKE